MWTSTDVPSLLILVRTHPQHIVPLMPPPEKKRKARNIKKKKRLVGSMGICWNRIFNLIDSVYKIPVLKYGKISS